MKIDELISELEQVKEEHGNLDTATTPKHDIGRIKKTAVRNKDVEGVTFLELR